MCSKAEYAKGLLMGWIIGMTGGMVACHWCHCHKKAIRKQVNHTARKVGRLIENVNDIF